MTSGILYNNVYSVQSILAGLECSAVFVRPHELTRRECHTMVEVMLPVLPYRIRSFGQANAFTMHKHCTDQDISTAVPHDSTRVPKYIQQDSNICVQNCCMVLGAPQLSTHQNIEHELMLLTQVPSELTFNGLVQQTP